MIGELIAPILEEDDISCSMGVIEGVVVVHHPIVQGTDQIHLIDDQASEQKIEKVELLTAGETYGSQSIEVRVNTQRMNLRVIDH